MGGETKNAKDSELACAGRVRCGLRLMLSHPSLASSLPWANKGVVSHFAKVRKSKFNNVQPVIMKVMREPTQLTPSTEQHPQSLM